jgi:uncharacterized protein
MGTRAFLGIGWKFPPQVTPQGGTCVASYEQRVEESIYMILGTSKGERLMLPDFGCGIHDLVFAPNNAATLARVVQEVQSALTNQERRIDVLDVGVDTSSDQPNLLLIRVTYQIRDNNAVGNIVYPFYLQEP